MSQFFIAQLFGIYFLVVGAIVLYRKQAIMPSIKELQKNRPVFLVFALIELVAGIAVVLTYPDVTLDWEGVVSLIGWMLAIESIIYLSISRKEMQFIVRKFTTPQSLQVSGIVAVVIGLYLSAVGFGFIS